jgi:hypothetical protein
MPPRPDGSHSIPQRGGAQDTSRPSPHDPGMVLVEPDWPPDAARLRRGISSSGGGPIGSAVYGASASATSCGVCGRWAGSLPIMRSISAASPSGVLGRKRAIHPGASRAERPNEELRLLPDVRFLREKRISIYGGPRPGAAVTRFGDGGRPPLLPWYDGGPAFLPSRDGPLHPFTKAAHRYSGLVTAAAQLDSPEESYAIKQVAPNSCEFGYEGTRLPLAGAACVALPGAI